MSTYATTGSFQMNIKVTATGEDRQLDAEIERLRQSSLRKKAELRKQSQATFRRGGRG